MTNTFCRLCLHKREFLFFLSLETLLFFKFINFLVILVLRSVHIRYIIFKFRQVGWYFQRNLSFWFCFLDILSGISFVLWCVWYFRYSTRTTCTTGMEVLHKLYISGLFLFNIYAWVSDVRHTRSFVIVVSSCSFYMYGFGVLRFIVISLLFALFSHLCII